MAEGQRLEMSACRSVKSLSRVSSSKVSGQVAQDGMTSRIWSQSGGQSTARLELKLFLRFGSEVVVVDLECCCSVQRRAGGRDEMVATRGENPQKDRVPRSHQNLPNQG